MPIQKFPDRFDGAPGGLRISIGDIEGVGLVHRYGINTNLTSAAETIWEPAGLYPFQTAGVSLEFLSTAAADTSAGTGAQAVRVLGFDDNFDVLDNVVATNGVGVVAVPDSYFRVNSFTVSTGGTGFTNAGDITLRVSGGGVTQSFIPAGAGLAPQCVATIGDNHGFITQWGGGTVAGNNDAANLFLVQRDLDNSTAFIRDTVQADSDATSRIAEDFEAPITVPPRSDIEIRGSSTAQNTGASAFFQVYIVEGLTNVPFL